MRTYNFQLLIGKENLKPVGQKYAGIGLWIDVSYSIDRGGNVSVYHIGAGEAAHRQINWRESVYTQITEAAKNNYQSQNMPHVGSSTNTSIENTQNVCDRKRITTGSEVMGKHRQNLQPLQSLS